MAVDAISSYNTLPATACLQVLLTAAESISSTYNALPVPIKAPGHTHRAPSAVPGPHPSPGPASTPAPALVPEVVQPLLDRAAVLLQQVQGRQADRGLT